MKKFAAVFYVTCFLFALECNQKRGTGKTTEPAIDTTHFFPVDEYIEQQINAIDTSNYFLYRLATNAGKQDSVRISKPVFDSFAKQFIAYNIADSAVKKFYKENVFQDESTDSYTISYTSTNDSLPVQNIEVLLSRQDEQVKRIFITVHQEGDDSTVIKKMGWKANSNFYINRIVSYKNRKGFEEQNMVAWREKN